MIYKNYLQAIQEHYRQKKNNNELSPLLLNPTPSNLRDECERVYKLRFVRKDLPILHTFFDTNDDSNVLKIIERFDITRFKPLSNFLNKGGIGGTQSKNVELLGWLLDFQPRPYNDRHDYAAGNVWPGKEAHEDEESDGVEMDVKLTDNGADLMAGTTGISKPAQETHTPVSKPTSPELLDIQRENKKKKGVIKKLVAIVGSVVITSGLIAAVLINIKDDGQCMIWVNDHYEPISCDSSANGKLIVARNENILRYMRRITRPDTLLEQDIRNVWYRKRRGDSLDYFTMGGRDPVEPTQNLKPLTVYMYKSYPHTKYSIDSSGGQ